MVNQSVKGEELRANEVQGGEKKEKGRLKEETVGGWRGRRGRRGWMAFHFYVSESIIVIVTHRWKVIMDSSFCSRFLQLT